MWGGVGQLRADLVKLLPNYGVTSHLFAPEMGATCAAAFAEDAHHLGMLHVQGDRVLLAHRMNPIYFRSAYPTMWTQGKTQDAKNPWLFGANWRN